ncbi:MAG: alpha/beta hydrolase-fold protein [Spirulinaceae cyanobacterium]
MTLSKHKSKARKFLLLAIASLVVTLLVAGAIYWYIYIAGAPQLDPPQETTKNTGMQFEVETYYSKAMEEQRKYGLILPPDYKPNSSQRYPVIFLLHGGPGDERDWAKKGAAITIIYQLYQQDKLPHAIVITPDGNDKRGSAPFRDPQYYDGPNGKVSTMLGSDLVEVIKSRYRTLDSPKFWAMGGLSSGGWGSLNIGLRHLDNFNVLFSHSSYFTDESGPQNSPQDFVSQIPVQERQKLRIYLDAGADDKKYVASTRKFHETLNQLGIANVFYVFPGGHGINGANVGWNYWNKHLVDSLSYVGKNFKIALSQKPSSKQQN